MKILQRTIHNKKLDEILEQMITASNEKLDFLGIDFAYIFFTSALNTRSKQLDHSHPLTIWFKAFRGRILSLQAEGRSGEVRPYGLDVSLLNFSFDLINLYINGCFPEEVLIKILDTQGFYGARYEILIASIFLASDYRIEWVDCDNNEKIPEFRAIKGDEVLLVEAKSRDYREVVDYEQPYLEALKIQNYLQKGIAKNLDQTHPFLVFYDLNLPFAAIDDEQRENFIELVKQAISNLGRDNEGRHFFDFAYISNWSWHYHLGEITDAQKKITAPLTPQKSFNPISTTSLDILNSNLAMYGSNDFRDKIITALKQS